MTHMTNEHTSREQAAIDAVTAISESDWVSADLRDKLFHGVTRVTVDGGPTVLVVAD